MIYSCPIQKILPKNSVCGCGACEEHRDQLYRARLVRVQVRDDRWTRQEELRKREWKEGIQEGTR